LKVVESLLGFGDGRLREDEILDSIEEDDMVRVRVSWEIVIHTRRQVKVPILQILPTYLSRVGVGNGLGRAGLGWVKKYHP
jgi:hypothetical protein